MRPWRRSRYELCGSRRPAQGRLLRQYWAFVGQHWLPFFNLLCISAEREGSPLGGRRTSPDNATADGSAISPVSAYQASQCATFRTREQTEYVAQPCASRAFGTRTLAAQLRFVCVAVIDQPQGARASAMSVTFLYRGHRQQVSVGPNTSLVRDSSPDAYFGPVSDES